MWREIRSYIDREMHNGLSIATGIAMETIIPTFEPIDIDRKFSHVNVDEFDRIYLNILTMVRNVVNATSTKINEMRPDRLLITLIEELELLSNALNKSELVLYIPDYTPVLKNVELRHLTPKHMGAKASQVSELADAVASLALKNKRSLNISILHDSKIMRTQKKVLMFTHIPIDMLNVFRNKKLFILESHTGNILERMDFNKKYHPVGKGWMGNLPWCELLLYLFGDKGYLTLQMEFNRKAILEALKRVTPLTSCTQVENLIKKVDPTISKRYKRIYS